MLRHPLLYGIICSSTAFPLPYNHHNLSHAVLSSMMERVQSFQLVRSSFAEFKNTYLTRSNTLSADLLRNLPRSESQTCWKLAICSPSCHRQSWPDPQEYVSPPQKLDQLRSLRRNAEGLCTKLYTLCRLCAFGPPDPGGARMASPKGAAISVDSFLFGGGQILPEQPKLRALLVKRFPEHPRMLNLDKVDRPAMEALFAALGSIQKSLEPWCQVRNSC